MKELCFLGIDTSNYTTSAALVTSDLRVLANLKCPLPVAAGDRGLRQSDALFAHTKQLPQTLEGIRPFLRGRTLAAVGVSERPRNQDGSYMPCFLAGVSAASAAALSAKVPLYQFSHQCGHLMAALVSAGKTEWMNAPFAAYHVSGGTTELVTAEAHGAGFRCEIVGGTRDISAGQLIDRVGVALGLRFPAGAEMEKLALAYTGRIPVRRPPVSDCRVNLSGGENLALKLYSESGSAEKTAAFVFSYIASALTEMTEQCFAKYGKRNLLCAGGVMSSAYLRHIMRERFGAETAEPALSSDNAVGVAALAAKTYRHGQGEPSDAE